jgi:ABC-type multidrug transport system fused ATPase/permease subunit
MRSSTRALLSLLKHNKLVYIVDALLMFFANASIALTPIFFGVAVGSAVEGNDYTRTGTFLLIGLIMNFIHWGTWHIADFWIIKRVHKDTYVMRDIAFKKVWSYPYATFIDKPSSKIAASVSRLHEEIRFLYDSLHYGFFGIAVYYTTLAVSIATISWQNSLVYVVFIILAIILLSKRAKNISITKAVFADKLAERNGNIYDSISNFTNVFSFNTKHKESQKNSQRVDSLFKAQYTSESSVVWFWVTASFMMRILLWTVIIGLNFYLLNKGLISQSGFAASIAVLASFSNQYWNLVHHIAEFGSRAASYDQNYSYLFGDRNIVEEYFIDEEVKTHSREFIHSLEVSKVSFSYPDSPAIPALKEVSFRLKKGEKIGVVGKSGGGKSTLVKLLLGFYAPSSGLIKLDDERIPTDELSQIVSYVPQDTTLFQETIGYNIGYSVEGPEATKEQIIKAAKKAHAHDFIIKMKDGYDTLVGERGVKLSLGQRQRVALARAFLKNTDLLVLDEATSSLDSKTEKDIQDSLEKLWSKKTVIAIAHRLSTLNNVDRIIVIDQGTIVESGTKKELLMKKGKFSELWNHQKNGLI